MKDSFGKALCRFFVLSCDKLREIREAAFLLYLDALLVSYWSICVVVPRFIFLVTGLKSFL